MMPFIWNSEKGKLQKEDQWFPVAKRKGKGLAAKGPRRKGSFSSDKVIYILIAMATKLQVLKLRMYI